MDWFEFVVGIGVFPLDPVTLRAETGFMIDIPQLPAEPARHFAILCSYAQLGPSRSLRRFSSEIHLPVPRLKSWSARFRWPVRLDDFDLRVAREEFRLINDELKSRAVDWAARQEQLREDEYQAGMALMDRARSFMCNPRLVATLSEIAEMLALASELARRACGPFPQENPVETLRKLEISEVVARVYASRPNTSLNPATTESFGSRRRIAPVPPGRVLDTDAHSSGTK